MKTKTNEQKKSESSETGREVTLVGDVSYCVVETRKHLRNRCVLKNI